MAIQDDAKNFLLSALSRAGGDLPSLQLEWLATQGYTRGTIDDRWQAYLSANAYYLPEGLSRLLVGLNRAIGNNWTPNLLYSDGDILLWYDPSDLTTMFKDTAGTQPVTADGDSVALMLDKGQWGGKSLTQVLAAQPELMSGGDFSSASGWVVSAQSSISGGVARVVSTDGSYQSIAKGTFPITAGKAYCVEVDIVAQTAGTLRVNATGLGTASFASGTGRKRIILIATATGSPSFYFDRAGGVTDITFDNASIKEIPGYHRVQATGTSMPKYKTDGTLHWLLYDGTDDGHATGTIPFNTVTSDGLARRNLLVDPDKFDHTTWTKTGITVSGGSPDDTVRVNNAINITTSALGYFTAGTLASLVQTYTSLPAGTYTYWMRVKADGYDAFQVRAATNSNLSTAVTNGTCLVDLTDGTLVDGTNGSVADLGDGYYRVGITFTIASPTTLYFGYWVWNSTSTTADGTDGYLITHAQLELGSTATDFQNIGTDEVAICAGVTKSSDAQSAMAIELSTSASANNGSFALLAPSTSGANSYRAATRGTIEGVPAGTGIFAAAPDTAVLSKETKISGDIISLRRNGTLVEAKSTDLGTGNFGSYAMYFGRRAGTSLPFNGREYQTVIRSRLLSAAELSSLETFVAAKTGVVL